MKKAIKVVFNDCFGGFSLSREASEMLNKAKGSNVCDPDFGYFNNDEIERHDRDLVSIVEKLKDTASGPCADLQVAKIKGNMYRIEEYDGNESVVEPSDVDWVVVK